MELNLLLSLILVALVVFIYSSYSAKSGSKSHSQPQSMNGQVFSLLVGACFGDKATALRLIRYEMDKEPRISERVATQRAYDRLKSDRSR